MHSAFAILVCVCVYMYFNKRKSNQTKSLSYTTKFQMNQIVELFSHSLGFFCFVYFAMDCRIVEENQK